MNGPDYSYKNSRYGIKYNNDNNQSYSFLFSLLFSEIIYIFRDILYTVNNIILTLKNHLLKYVLLVNSSRRVFLKRYVYTINHKQIAINYLYFSMFTGLSGAALATFIRMELAVPGSLFFKGDSLRYLQVITAHGLIMVFFVVVPILFGAFANFLIPYHVGSKDVAFPRLNSIGFWIQPCGYILVAKIAFLRPQYWRYYDKPINYLPFLEKVTEPSYPLSSRIVSDNVDKLNKVIPKTKTISSDDLSLTWRGKKPKSDEPYSFYSNIPVKLDDVVNTVGPLYNYVDIALRNVKARRKKIFFTKCSDRTLTTAGWAFVTPLSSNTKYTNVGSQDILIVSVIFAGISTTISFTNLLITRRTLSMPGLNNRRALLPFITISLLLTMRMLAVVTPVLGASMFMLLMDRHWQTTFFEFVYGGDTILFQHLFWFFGHPEVYILIIPTFGFVNMVLPNRNTRRIASKQHLIWAIYIMAYMGFAVWGHHMYLVGLDHRSRSLYSTITIMISLPATVKLVNWTLTMFNGAMKFDVTLAFAICYIIVFITGGFTGMWLSHVGLNISMHDTFYVIAHFHLMLSGSTIMGCFLGVYHYYTSLFGVKYSRNFAYLHLIYYFGGQWLTFLPMFWLGLSGLPRRIHDYPSVFTGWHSMASAGHLITMVGVFFFFITLIDSFLEKKIPTFHFYGIPRFYKRSSYYLFKIRYLTDTLKKNKTFPNHKSRIKIINYFGESEFEPESNA